jgi:hypothetical protein
MAVSPWSSVFNLAGWGLRAFEAGHDFYEGIKHPEAKIAGIVVRDVIPKQFSRPVAFALTFARLVAELGISLDDLESAALLFQAQAENKFPSQATSHPLGEIERNTIHVIDLTIQSVKVMFIFLRFVRFFSAQDDQIENIFVHYEWLIRKRGEIDLKILDKFRKFFARQDLIPSVAVVQIELAALRVFGFFLGLEKEEEVYSNPLLTQGRKLRLPPIPPEEREEE